MSRDRRFERARTDYYARIPARVVAALDRGELEGDDFLLLSYFVAKIELNRVTSEFSFSLSGLADVLGRQKEHLRRRLHRLHDGGWITFETPPRARGAMWTLRVARAAVDGELPLDLNGTATHAPPMHHSDGGLPEEVLGASVEVLAAPNPLPQAFFGDDDASSVEVLGTQAEQSRAEQSCRSTSYSGATPLRDDAEDEPLRTHEHLGPESAAHDGTVTAGNEEGIGERTPSPASFLSLDEALRDPVLYGHYIAPYTEVENGSCPAGELVEVWRDDHVEGGLVVKPDPPSPPPLDATEDGRRCEH